MKSGPIFPKGSHPPAGKLSAVAWQSRLALLALLTFFWTSCESTGVDGHYGMVELFHGKPKMMRMVPRHLLGPMPSGTMPSHTIQGIAVMDTGCDYKNMTSLTYLSNLVSYYVTNVNYQGDIPCHYFIDRDGKVFAGRNIISPGEVHEEDPFLLRCGETTEKEIVYARLGRKRSPVYNLRGYILICLLGDYDAEMVYKPQEKSLFQLCAYLAYQNNIPLEKITSLRALYPQTKNPGFYLNNYLQASILSRNIPPPPAQSRFMAPPSGVGKQTE